MIDLLIKYFEQHVVLDENEKNFIRLNIPIITLDKDQFLLTEGEVSDKFYFILKGCIRLFYLNDTEEKTAFFYVENQFVSSYESFTKQIPTKHNLQSIEPTTVAVISTEVTQSLLNIYPKFEFLARTIMEEELIILQDIISSFIMLNAEQRYLKLLKSKKDLLQRIPQYQLATFLGVTPETLSRIRKRIVTK